MARRSPQAVDWASLCREWRGSGLTQPEFCRSHGISLHTFRRRLYHPDARGRIGDAAHIPSVARAQRVPLACLPSPRFIPVHVTEEHRRATAPIISSPGRSIEVILACGRRIAVPPGFDPETLCRVVLTLEQAGC